VLTRLALAYSERARARRGRLFRELLPLTDDDRLLDLGSEDGSHIAGLIPFRRNVWIADIAAEALARGAERYGFHTTLLDETGRLPFPDGHFDCVFCSSVIEHVTVDKDALDDYPTQAAFRSAAWERQRILAAEIARVGRRFFVQTPHRWFPIESHTWLPVVVVLLPRRAQIRLIASLNRWWPKRTAADFSLLTTSEMEALFPGAEIFRERSFGMTKSLIAIRR
jgi:hypothetical protein